MTRWKLTIEYDGTGFCGWQRQTHDISVQHVLEDAIRKFSGEDASLHAAGRTDTGVHAEGQVAHVDLNKETTADTIRDAVNFHAKPHKAVILAAEPVPNTFHARFSARGRRYRYQILNRRAAPALLSDYVWHMPRLLDIAAMRQAAAHLIGQHDFSTFRAKNCQAQSPVKTLDRLDIAAEGDMIIFRVEARSFLYHQVRNMVGTLAQIGTGQWTLPDFKTAFAAKDRTKGGPTAPPQGLFFEAAFYPQEN
jgi:tRNA pseudouridine38-40 synthase